MLTQTLPLAAVVAMSKNKVIGINGQLPWHLPEDLKHFRQVTLNHAVIMGRKTYESIGKPLVKRRNIIISHDISYSAHGCDVVHNLDEALLLARSSDDCPRIIGGATIYYLSINLMTDLYLTEINREIAGDTFFPDFDRSMFSIVEQRQGESKDVTFLHLKKTCPP